MAAIKEEKAFRQRALRRSRLDLLRRVEFVRLVDYMLVERLVKHAETHQEKFRDQFVTDGDFKTGLFKTSIAFGEQTDEMRFSPGEAEAAGTVTAVADMLVRGSCGLCVVEEPPTYV
jgi:hypothetical protein